jgi:hypothetical protein
VRLLYAVESGMCTASWAHIQTQRKQRKGVQADRNKKNEQHCIIKRGGIITLGKKGIAQPGTRHP